MVEEEQQQTHSTSVSILMPVFNGIEFLSESVSSVLNQTVDTWELIIAVNGYPPNSSAYNVVRNYCDILGDDRIRVFDYHDCKGKPATLNKMISQCRHNYVALLDVDDCWLPNKLATQMPYLAREYDVVGTKCVYFGDMNDIIPDIPTGDITAFNFLQVNPIINSSSVIKKELASWDTTCFVEDYELWLRMWRQGKRFYNCEDVLIKHRIHRASAFNAQGNDRHVFELRKKYS
jgi:glycosyltransferase involved in cell wall biosynthesis